MTPLLLDINAPEFVLLLVLAIILFGPEKLPELARGSGRALIFSAEGQHRPGGTGAILPAAAAVRAGGATCPPSAPCPHARRRRRGKDGGGLLRDDAFLVGGDDQQAKPAFGRADAAHPGRVGGRVQFGPQPAEARGHAGADGGLTRRGRGQSSCAARRTAVTSATPSAFHMLS